VAKTFGELIGGLRQERGLSVYALARRTGLSDQAIHDLEGSDRQPSFETVRRLAAALGVTLDWVAGQLPAVDLPPQSPGRPRGRPRKVPVNSAPAETAPKRPRGRPRKGH
jgi:transcriptional regulator with XRE-family HTH domain